MAQRVRYRQLPTEQRHSHSDELDRLPTIELLRLMHREDAHLTRAVGAALPTIARATRLIVSSLEQGGRLFFIGAGTSGRLGVLEAAECPPTFSISPSLVQAIIAGGRNAVFRSREGAEDTRSEARTTVRQRVRRGDVVVGIAASGVTPFVDEALRTASHRGARTILLTCNPQALIPAECRIILSVGPELLTGSTRLKAGTATKLVLNMLTLSTMIRLGKTYGNLMIDVRPTSRKLLARARHIVQSVLGCSEDTAAIALRNARGHAKAAILMAAEPLSYHTACRRLNEARGSLREALRLQRAARNGHAQHTMRLSRRRNALHDT